MTGPRPEPRRHGQSGAAARAVIPALVVLLLGLRIYAELTYDDCNQDKVRQLLIAEAFAQGAGFSLCTADPADLSASVYTPVRQWPVGYPLAVAALAPLAGGIARAAAALDVAAIAVLCGCLIWLSGQLRLTTAGRAWLLAFSALSFTPYIWWGSTDLQSATGYLLAVALALRGFAAERPTAWVWIGAGLALFWAALHRYPYYALAGVIPIALLAAGLRLRDRRLVRGGLISGAAALLPLLGLLALHIQMFGAAFWSSSGDGLLYPGNLTHIDSFPLKAAVYTDVLTENLLLVLPGLEEAVRALALALSAAILAAVLVPSLAALRATAARRRPSPIGMFHLLTAATIAANVALLAWFSLVRAPQTDWTVFFTYVQGTRYYAPSMLLIQLALAWLLFGAGGLRGSWRRAALAAAGGVMLLTVAYSGYRAFKVHALDDRTVCDGLQHRVTLTLDAMHAACGGDLSRAVYADTDLLTYSCMLALRSRARIVLDIDTMLDGIASRAPVDLFVAVGPEPDRRERAFLAAHDAKPILDMSEAVVYQIEVGP